MARKLAKGFLGTNNFDTNSRLCMASAAVGYARSLGADGPPAAYADLELADCFLLIGTNTADCHPDRLEAHPEAQARRSRRRLGDRRRPALHRDRRHRRSAPAASAGLGHRAAQRDAPRAVEGGPLDRAFIADAHVGLGRRCAPSSRAIRRSARRRHRALGREHRGGGARFGRARAALTLWSMGINQSHVGTDKNAAILNLHLATGRSAVPAPGPSRSPASRMPWAAARPAASPSAARLSRRDGRDGARRRRAALGRARAGSRPRPAARRSRSSRGWPRARCAPSGSSAPIRPPRCPTSTWSRRRSARPSW